MKKQIQLFVLASVMLATNAIAKGQSGIYKTAADYSAGKLAYEHPCTRKGNSSIRLHDFFGDMPNVIVKDSDKKYRLKKDELYGYKNCNGEVYRFYRHAAYKIAESSHIFIYTKQQNVTQIKGYKVVNSYYFSATPSGRIYPLTLNNLSIAFGANEQFMDLLYRYSSTGEVSSYDRQHATFKINYLFNKSISK